MRKSRTVPVGKFVGRCLNTVFLYTVNIFRFFSMSIKTLFVRPNAAKLTQPFPHSFSEFSSVIYSLPTYSTGPINITTNNINYIVINWVGRRIK